MQGETEAADLFCDQKFVFVDMDLVYSTPKCWISIQDQDNRTAGWSQPSFQANISWVSKQIRYERMNIQLNNS